MKLSNINIVNRIGRKVLFLFLSLAMILGMLVINSNAINAISTPTIKTENTEGLETTKTIVESEVDGKYKLNLSAWATGSVQTSTTTEHVPLDIVLVLDQSGSMSYPLDPNAGSSYKKTFNGDTVTAKQVGDRGAPYGSPDIYYEDNGKYYKIDFETNYGSGQKTYTAYYVKDRKNYTIFSFAGEEKVLDNRFYVKYKPSRLDNLISSVSSFVDAVEKESSENNVNHRIAIAGFASDDYDNTEILTGCDVTVKNPDLGGTYYYPNNKSYIGVAYDSSSNNYKKATKNALQDLSSESGYKNVNEAIGYLTAHGATRTDHGMKMANDIITNREVKTYVDTAGKIKNRQSIVIVFTDGEPTSSNGFESSVANSAITTSKTLKDSKALVYSIGIFEDASNADITDKNPSTSNANKFMHALSSNYPFATGFSKESNRGVRAENTQGDKSFYKTASNSDELSQVFTSIKDTISSGSTQVTIGEEATLTDYIASSFDINKVTSNDVHVYYQDYKGNDTWGTPYASGLTATTDLSAKKIFVSGFDYSKEYILENDPDTNRPKGRRIVLEIEVSLIDGFIGGNNVASNTKYAGIYDENDEMIEKFREPNINIGISFKTEGSSKSIYITNSWNQLEQFFDNVDKDGLQYRQGDKEYTIDGKVNAYVDITYTVFDQNNNIVGTYQINHGQTNGKWQNLNFDSTILNANSSYTIRTLVHPISDGKTADNGGNFEVGNTVNEHINKINVFTPVIECKDAVIFYGDDIANIAQSIDSVKWHCVDNPKAEKPDEDMPVPELSYDFIKLGDESQTPVVGEIKDLKKDTNFVVSKVMANDREIYLHNNADLQFAEIKTENCDKLNHEDGRDFTIHVVTGELKISKKIDEIYSNETEINSYQTFIFKVERRDKVGGEVKETFYQTISFESNKLEKSLEATISNLKKGYYTVTEETTWFKKYNLNSVFDNYKIDGTGENLYIGEKNEDSYYGLDTTCFTPEMGYKGTAATVAFENNLKSWLGWQSDVAGSKNIFNK